jgi:integrase
VLALHPRTVKRMIAAVKASDNLAAKAFLALSTTYGLRSQEMINLSPIDVRPKDQMIYIASQKKMHFIPEQIFYYVDHYDFSKPRSQNFMLNLWRKMERLIDLPHYDNVGWHAIRRTLITLLLLDLPEPTVYAFMRWKQKASSDTALRYSRIRFVGVEGEVHEFQADFFMADHLVFGQYLDGTRIHPFIDFWR